MDQEEKKLLEEANAIRRHEIELKQAWVEMWLLICLTVVTVVVGGLLVWWGVSAMRTMPSDIARAVFTVSLAAAFVCSVGAMDPGASRGRIFVFVLLMLASIFVFALSWPRF